MGNESSFDKSPEDFLKEYELIRTEYDERFKEVKIFRSKNKQNKKIVTKERIFKNKEEADRFLKQANKRKALYNDNVARLLAILSKSQKHNFRHF